MGTIPCPLVFAKKRKKCVFLRNRLHYIISTTVLLLAVQILFAQNVIRVQGKVNTSAGEALPFSTVIVVGTTTGVVADIEGRFSIEAPSNGVLRASFTGYQSTDIQVGGRTQIDFVLIETVFQEVVVIGYGSLRKKDVTGAVTSVSEATLREVPAPNLISQLKGRAAGVSIVSNSSTSGAQGQIRIRGNRTLTTSSGASDGLYGPLVVVDGIPFGGLNDINPDDITSLDILKDDSAAAIYGSRGAGGVILVTTKRGKIGKPVLSYDGYHGITSILGKYNVMNCEEYAQFKTDAATYNRSSPGTSAYLLTNAEKEALAAGISTNWQDLIFNDGFMINHQLGLQGGVENTQYSLGAGYFNETGIIPNQDFQRYNMRVTLDQILGKRVKIGLNTINTLTYANNPGGGGVP